MVSRGAADMATAGGKCGKTVALLGAPNSGKTTLFNRLTGSTELVANWPGATVDVKYAEIRLDGAKTCLVDLPGVYSLRGSGPEEKVTREFIIREKPDAVLVLADSTTLERSLYLPLEALELYEKVVVALTKIDAAREQGIEIDVKGLSEALGVPVVAVSAITGEGLDELKAVLLAVVAGKLEPRPRLGVIVPEKLRGLHTEITGILEAHGLAGRLAAWLAQQLLAGEDWALGLVEELAGQEARRRVEELLRRSGVDPEEAAVEVVTAKYRVAEELASRFSRRAAVPTPSTPPRIDRVFLHPVLGPLVSLATLFAIFMLAYMIALGSPVDVLLEKLGFAGAAEFVSEYNLVSLTAGLMDALAEAAMRHIPHPVLARLIGEGILSSGYGVGLVVSFLPLVGVFMALVAVLEDSGLVPRIAAGMDHVFRRLGVSGKAVFPALLSFGCNVPAVISSRVMDTEAERRAVLLALPLLPCTARYTVIMAFSYAFFTGHAALVAFSVYMAAILLFMATVRLASRLEGAEPEEFLLELPPLKRPSLRVVWWLTWDKVKHFIVRAGTVILAASVALWLLSNYGPGGYLGENGSPAQSYAAALGKLLAPYAELIAGTDPDTSWRIGFGLIGGFLAKEVFLDSLASVAPGQVAETGEPAATLRAYHLEPWQAYPLLLAVTLYIPCVATLAAIYSETRSNRFTAMVAAYSLALATLAALVARAILEALLA